MSGGQIGMYGSQPMAIQCSLAGTGLTSCQSFCRHGKAIGKRQQMLKFQPQQKLCLLFPQNKSKQGIER
jgi:hypothetical protein